MKVNALVDGINSLIKPSSSLRFYGVDYHMGPLWILSGITPVGVDGAIVTLEDEGENVRNVKRLFKKQEEAKARAWKKRMRLVESAKKKLTPAEIAACNL